MEGCPKRRSVTQIEVQRLVLVVTYCTRQSQPVTIRLVVVTSPAQHHNGATYMRFLPFKLSEYPFIYAALHEKSIFYNNVLNIELKLLPNITFYERNKNIKYNVLNIEFKLLLNTTLYKENNKDIK